MRERIFLAAVVVIGTLLTAACTGATATSGSSSVSTRPTPGSVTPSGPVRVGGWIITIHSAQSYPNRWNAPAGLPGTWGYMGARHMAVVLDVSAQNSATPAPNTGGAFAGPRCTLRGGSGMMGPMMGSGAYGWQMRSPGMYRGPMAFMAPTSTRQFTLVCADPATGNQADWNIGF